MYPGNDRAERKVPLHFLVPERKVEEIKKIVLVLGGIEEGNPEEEEMIAWTEAFPDTHPGEILKGYRLRDGLTQKGLAEKIKAKQSHVSQMEKGLRPIGVAMAKKLAGAFKTDYKVFF